LTDNLASYYRQGVLTSVQKVGPALDLFDVRRPEWGVSEVAGALGTSKSSAHELLTTMESVGLLERTTRARYRLGWRLLSLSHTLVTTSAFRDPSARALRRAVERWGDPMHLAALDRGAVVYLECVRTRGSVPLPTRIGARLPAHPSAVGKVLLAGRDDEVVARYARRPPLRRYTDNTIVDPDALIAEVRRARAEGVAFDREETIAGLCCVGAPVRGADGSVVAAVSVSAPTARFERHADTYVRLVREVAREGSVPS
jgi:DNA-binding IclR family transcriptional regulator